MTRNIIMTQDVANKILEDPTNWYDMTGIEKALLTLVKDLQVRVAELTMKLEGVSKETSNG